MANLDSSSKAPENKQIMLMRKARASASFDTAELSSLLWDRYVDCATNTYEFITDTTH
jgi:hypothetical protein